jgi:hypothetical protein
MAVPVPLTKFKGIVDPVICPVPPVYDHTKSDKL